MKKLLAVILIAILGTAGYFFWRFFQKSFPETIFPQATIAYVYFHDISEAKKNLPKTALWQQIQKSPRQKSYQRQLERARYFLESVSGVDFQPLFQQFKKELALGVYAIAQSPSGPAFLAYVDSESDTQKFFLQRFDPSLKRRLPDLQKFGLTYNGITYFRYNSHQLPPSASPCYAITSHHLMLTYSEASMKTLIDVKKGKIASLSKSDHFKNAKKKIGFKRGLLLYVDAESALNLIKASLSPERQKFWPAVIRISGINGLESFVYNVSVKDQGFEETGFLSLKPQREGLLKIYFQQQPQQLKSLTNIPADSKVMNSGTLPDFAKMWDEVNAELNTILSPSQYDKWQKIQSAMKGIFNFDIRRDVLEPLGNEFSFSYEASDQLLSNPSSLKYLVILQLRNPQKFRETLDRLVSLASLRGLQQKQEDYHGKKLETFGIQVGQFSAAPAYCLEDSWFYFSTEQGLLKKAIDANAQKKNIQSLTDYQKVTSGFPDDVNGLSYTNVNAYLQMYASILNKQAQDPENRWIHEYGLQEEFTSLAQNLFGAASYSKIEKDGMYIHSYASVPTSFLSLPAIASALPNILKQYNSRNAE